MSLMNKMMTSAILMGTAGMATYVLMNKATKKKADKLINTMIEEANDMIKQNSTTK